MSLDVNKTARSLEHLILKQIRRQPVTLGTRVLVGCSGGLDSSVLLHVLRKWQKLLKIEKIAVAHVHHGWTKNQRQWRYRNRVQQQLAQFCKVEGLQFLTNSEKSQAKLVSQAELVSEAKLRTFRYEKFQGWLKEGDFQVLALAHHLDDLLETRMLRLIRGTGPQGLVAMQPRSGQLWRPLLGLSRSELEVYAQSQKLKFFKDPSNQSDQALRNWLRNKWLPDLEKKVPGAKKALARSLELTASPKNLSAKGLENLFALVREGSAEFDALSTTRGSFVGLRRKSLQRQSSDVQEALVAKWLHHIGTQGYGQTHVSEILKRLDTRRKTFKFEMLGVNFHVTSDLLWASRV